MKKMCKIFPVLLMVIAVLSLAVVCPPSSMAAQKPNAERGTISEKVATPNASFDADKMSDMSDFDPATWVSPTGDTIKIAAVCAFSGPGAFNGNIVWAVNAWVAHDINKRGGIWVDGKKKLIEVIKADHMGKADDCKRIVERMVLQEKVHVLSPSAGSHLVKITNSVASQNKVISHNFASMANNFQDAENFSPHNFMTAPSSDQIGRAWAYYYGKIRKKEKKFYIICQDYSYGHDIGEGFKQGLKEYYPEAQVVGEDYHKLFLTDFAPYLTKIKASGAEVMVTGNWVPDGGNLLKQARQLGIKIPVAHIYMNDPTMLHDVGVEGTAGLIHVDEFGTPPPAFKSPGYIKYEKAWNDQWKNKWKTPPYNSHFFEHGDYLQKFIMHTYWLFSVIERAKSTDPEKIIKIWENDSYAFVNGKIIMMRACDHKAIQDFTIQEYVRPDQQKISYNIPPYHWYTGCSAPGPGFLVPASKVLPWMDQKQTRCTGKNDWGE
jgi:branched-chain amino acid transport system substrate-binding protein